MTVMTIGELLMEANELLEEASILDARTEIPLDTRSKAGKELLVIHQARTQAQTYLVLKSLSYSQLAQARMQYEDSVAV